MSSIWRPGSFGVSLDFLSASKGVVQHLYSSRSFYVQMATERVEQLSEVQAFAYRVPRFAAILPVEFLAHGCRVAGFTQNISEKGLLVRFASPVLPGTAGKLRLMVETCAIEVEAEVTHAELFEAGLRFRFASQAEKNFVEMLVKVVSRNMSRWNARSSLRVPSR